MQPIEDQLQQREPDQWKPCSGEISHMVNRLEIVERRRRMRQLASTATLSLVLFAVGAVLIGGFVIYREPQFGGIGCTECLSHAPAYHDHLTGVAAMTDLELAERIKTHLDLCKCCKMKFNETYPDAAIAAMGRERPWPLSGQVAFSVPRAGPLY